MSAGETRHVLVLYSNGRMLPANVDADRGLQEAIAKSRDRPTELHAEFLDYPAFEGESYAHAFTVFLQEKYALHPPDVVIAAGAGALEFLLHHRAELFPTLPVVYMGISRAALQAIPPLPDDVIGVPVDYDYAGTIDLALRWHPRARRLVVVTGAAAPDREVEARLRDEVGRFEGRVAVEFLAGLPTSALQERLGRPGPEEIVFTPGYFQDGNGRSITPRESAEMVAAAASAPVYGPFSTFLGTGVVGGRVASFEAMGRQAGQVVNALLDGASPASIQLPEIMPTTVTVDWRQVRRWGIDEAAIPGDAVVLFRTPSFLEAHRTESIVAVVAFLLQTLLIAGLLVERHRRRQTERTLENQRFQLAHASRLAVAGELTASIAHEINQPLGAILSNAEAAELILESGVNRRDELREILADIRRDDLRASEVIRRLRTLLARHEVELQPFDLNETLSDAESVLRAEAKRRRVTLDVRPAATPVTVVGDRIQIQQVLINLVLNALDAVADAPEARRTVLVVVENGAGRASITVRDRGHGIPPEHLPRLFESFFSTKRAGMGLGLPIARTLVETHGGRIWAENRDGEGAVFHVELPAQA